MFGKCDGFVSGKLAFVASELPELDLPVYFFHGVYDYTCSYTVAKSYPHQACQSRLTEWKRMTRQEPIKAMLAGGNPRVLARTEEVVQLVLGDKARLQELYRCLLEGDEIVRMRASDALEKVCRQRPAWLQAYVPQLFTEVAAIEQASVQCHLAQILGEVELTPSQHATACRILKRNLAKKKDWMVVIYSMDTLAKFSRDDDQLRPEVLAMLKGLLSDPHRSIVTRAHKLIAALARSSISSTSAIVIVL